MSWLSNEWWWLHFVLLGALLGRSLGMWAYRDVWYALSTFLSGPSDTSGLFRMLRQWLAALVLAVPASLTVGLALTAHWTWGRIEEDGRRYGVIVGAVAVWLIAVFLMTVRRARVRGNPSPFGSPIQWARFRANEAPDTIVVTWIDTVLGALLHGGVLAVWTYLATNELTSAGWQACGYAASGGVILLCTTISLLLHPQPISHEEA